MQVGSLLSIHGFQKGSGQHLSTEIGWRASGGGTCGVHGQELGQATRCAGQRLVAGYMTPRESAGGIQLGTGRCRCKGICGHAAGLHNATQLTARCTCINHSAEHAGRTVWRCCLRLATPIRLLDFSMWSSAGLPASNKALKCKLSDSAAAKTNAF